MSDTKSVSKKSYAIIQIKIKQDESSLLKGVPNMKIENNYNRVLQSIKQAQNQKGTSKAEEKLEQVKAKAVEVSISDEAKKLSEASLKESQTNRVEEIKAAIQNDSYEVNPETIAEGMIRTIGHQKGTDE